MNRPLTPYYPWMNQQELSMPEMPRITADEQVSRFVKWYPVADAVCLKASQYSSPSNQASSNDPPIWLPGGIQVPEVPVQGEWLRGRSRS